MPKKTAGKMPTYAKADAAMKNLVTLVEKYLEQIDFGENYGIALVQACLNNDSEDLDEDETKIAGWILVTWNGESLKWSVMSVLNKKILESSLSIMEKYEGKN